MPLTQGLTNLNDNAGVAADLATMEAALLAAIQASAAVFAGTSYFVATDGNDTNTGLSADMPFLTIGHGITQAVAGDAIRVKAGAYDEDGLDLALDAVELICDHGVVLSNTNPGTVLMVSGDYCRVSGIAITQAGQVGIAVTGSHNRFEVCAVRGCTIGYNITTSTNEFILCNAGNSTVTGFAIAAGSTRCTDCVAVASGGATRGFYISAGTRTRLVRCISDSNATRGYQIDAAATDNIVMQCIAGGSDGPVWDAGVRNTWPYFAQGGERASHEHMYPVVGGEGVNSPPITINNTVTDDSGAGPWSDQYYWGDTKIIIPPATLTEAWRSLGMYIEAATAVDTQPWEVFFTSPKYESARNGGNDWDYQETILTVVDGTNFAVGDKVWITGTGALDGEICDVADVTGNVVTITSEDRISADTGLKFDYAGAEVMYVVYRAPNGNLHGYDGMYSAANIKWSLRMLWETPKQINQDGGAIMRMYNATDADDSAFDARMIYQD